MVLALIFTIIIFNCLAIVVNKRLNAINLFYTIILFAISIQSVLSWIKGITCKFNTIKQLYKNFDYVQRKFKYTLFGKCTNIVALQFF